MKFRKEGQYSVAWISAPYYLSIPTSYQTIMKSVFVVVFLLVSSVAFSVANVEESFDEEIAGLQDGGVGHSEKKTREKMVTIGDEKFGGAPYTGWEAGDPESLMAAAEAMGRHHSVPIPHPKERGRKFTYWNVLLDSSEEITFRLDKILSFYNEEIVGADGESDSNFVEVLKNIQGRILDLKLAFTKSEWPEFLVWSTANRLQQKSIRFEPADETVPLVHRGFDVWDFFVTDIVGKSCNWDNFPIKIDQLLFLELYCKKYTDIVKDSSTKTYNCQSFKFQETLRIEAVAFSLPVHATHGVKNLLKAMNEDLPTDDRIHLFTSGYQHITRWDTLEDGVIANLAHSKRARELFHGDL